MRPLLLAALLAAAVATPAAHADPAPVQTGTGCVFNTLGAGGGWHGVVYGGPLAAAELPPPADPGAVPVSITLTCTLHVYGAHPDPAVEASGTGTSVAVVAPVPVSFEYDVEQDTLAMCSTAVVTGANGATYTYYEDLNNGWWYPYDVGCYGGKCLAFGPQCDHTLRLLTWLLDQVPPVRRR